MKKSIKVDVRGYSKSFSIEDEMGDPLYEDQLFTGITVRDSR